MERACRLRVLFLSVIKLLLQQKEYFDDEIGKKEILRNRRRREWRNRPDFIARIPQGEGADVYIISPDVKGIYGFKQFRRSKSINPDKVIAEAKHCTQQKPVAA